MKSIALLTPWPPQHSGIADYAFDLATLLVSHDVQLTIFTTAAEPVPLEGTRIVIVSDPFEIGDMSDFDCVVYQLGNNTDCHLWMIPLLEKFPGVIHLHDMVMHHIAAWLTWLQGDAAGYLGLLEKWYGKEGLEAGRHSLESHDYLWDSGRIADFPLCEEYLQDARAIIVHSSYALAHVRQTTAHVPSFQLPQLYQLAPRQHPTQELRRISVLGGVDPQKRLEWILDALAKMQQLGCISKPLELHVVGAVDRRCEHLIKRAAELRDRRLEVRFHGRVDKDQFDLLFENTDLCIALRHPTMGETSAIVMRALQKGIPVIVNDVGWYGELPASIVRKLPVEGCAEALAELLQSLFLSPEAFREWNVNCLQYARSAFSLQNYGNRYLEICDNPEGVELETDILAEVLADCGMTGSDEEDQLLNQLLLEIDL